MAAYLVVATSIAVLAAFTVLLIVLFVIVYARREGFSDFKTTSVAPIAGATYGGVPYVLTPIEAMPAIKTVGGTMIVPNSFTWQHRS